MSVGSEIDRMHAAMAVFLEAKKAHAVAHQAAETARFDLSKAHAAMTAAREAMLNAISDEPKDAP